MAVLWTTHLLDEVQAEDRLLLLHQGRLIANDSAAILGEGGLAAAFERLTA
ncbi:hypothetical protein D3C81_2006800 [compost metagenome]